jgi:hypothetical protein
MQHAVSAAVERGVLGGLILGVSRTHSCVVWCGSDGSTGDGRWMIREQRSAPAEGCCVFQRGGLGESYDVARAAVMGAHGVFLPALPGVPWRRARAVPCLLCSARAGTHGERAGKWQADRTVLSSSSTCVSAWG